MSKECNLFRQRSQNNNERIKLAVKLGLWLELFVLLVILSLFIYLSITKQSNDDFLSSIKIAFVIWLCTVPIFVPIFVLGSYIQIGYMLLWGNIGEKLKQKHYSSKKSSEKGDQL